MAEEKDWLERIEQRLGAIHKKLDDDGRRRADAAIRHFSSWRADDNDATLKARHDAEAHALQSTLEKGGTSKEEADSVVTRGRADAERCDGLARQHFTARRDDDDDATFKARRDAEEEGLAEHLEKEEKAERDDARRVARSARLRRDDSETSKAAEGEAEERTEAKAAAKGDKARDDKARDDKARHDDAPDVQEELERHGLSKEDAKRIADRMRGDAHRRDDKAARDDKARDDRVAARDDRVAARDDRVRDDRRADALASENQTLKDQVAALNAWRESLSKEIPAFERDALARAQARADAAMVAFNDRASPPMPGETSLAYRIRQVDRLKKYSKRFEKSNLGGLDTATLEPVEEIIYADAQEASRQHAGRQVFALYPETKPDVAGRMVTKFHGDPMAWMGYFMSGGQRGSILRQQKT